METEETYDAIVVGAGVAGLIAARDLARAGQKVAVLEARSRVGGRILCSRGEGRRPIEMGPEFVHGAVDSLNRLLDEAGAERMPAPEADWLVENGRLRRCDDLWERIGAVLDRIEPSDQVVSLADWFRSPESIATEWERKQTCDFVQEFHAGTAETTSARTLRETRGGVDEEQQRILNGYDRIVLTLAEQCFTAGAEIHLNAVVSGIEWRPGTVVVRLRKDVDEPEQSLRARTAVITTPLGVLKALPGQLGAIQFTPELEEKRALLERMTMGWVFRLSLRFRDELWESTLVPSELRASRGKDFGFVHATEEAVPIWWSRAPEPVLVGWAGGPAARKLAGRNKPEVVHLALSSLARICGCSSESLSALLEEAVWHDWAADPFCRGGYTYSIAGLEDAPERLAEPVEETLFFAGEATSAVVDLGTVGGALDSGARAASEVLAARSVGRHSYE